MSEYFILILVIEYVHLSSKNQPVGLLVTEIMDHTNSFFLRNSYVFNQNRFLISSFTKWTHNRPHSNITEDRMGKIMNFQENAVMASKLLEAMLLVTLVILLMTTAF